MSTQVRHEANLRERQREATREEIVSTGMRLLSAGEVVSHEAIAAASGMSARTVYRHFPSRDSLIEAMWQRLREETNTRFPQTEQEIAHLSAEVYRNFDKHEALVRAFLFSGVGSEVRDRGAEEGRTAFTAALAGAVRDLPPAMKRKVVGVFMALYSAPAWQLMRDRGQLTSDEAAEAVAWAVQALLQNLNSAPEKDEVR